MMHLNFLLILFALVFIAEVSLGGSGVWSEYLFGFNLRKVVFSLFYFSIFTKVMLNLDYKFVLYAVFVSVFFLIWTAFIPIIKGNLINSLSDSSSLIAIVLLFPISRIIPAKNLKKIVLFAGKISLTLAFIHIGISLALYLNWVSPTIIRQALLAFFIREGEIAIFSIEPNLRIFWASSSFMLIGYAIFFFKAVNERKNKMAFFCLFIHCIAILITDTRAFQMFLILVPILYFLLLSIHGSRRDTEKKYIITYILLLVLVELLFVVMINPSFLQIVGLLKPGEDASVRLGQVIPLLKGFLEHLSFGQGFGASAKDLVRSESSPWTYELSILALLMKLGLIGTLSLLVVLFMSLYLPFSECVENNNNQKLYRKQMSLLGAVGLAYLLVASSNPFLFSLVGVALMLTIYSWYVLNVKYRQSI
ncbi:hypothetical protein ACP7H9_09620 [Idiomarina sp. ST20R2A10]|uniref:hypothetical protein n=1 Tax=Idiomarina sp. ST20R2A10 TaxID=3418369 RepID=UPI003EC53129